MRSIIEKRNIMLTIQSLLKNVYYCIKSISKKSYRNCAIIVSGFLVLAMISLNAQAFGGAGKNKVVSKERNSIKENGEESSEEEETEKTGLIAGPQFITTCKLAVEEQSKIEQKSGVIQRQSEVVKECINLETVEQMQKELPKQSVNPYQELQLSETDYEALGRIVQAEAGGEDERGKILVAEVILNRVLSDGFEDTVYDVIFEKKGGSAQFAPTVDGRYFTVEVTEETREAVEKALYEEDYSQGALFFSARSKANPNDMAWFDHNLKWLFQYGGHEFYTLP